MPLDVQAIQAALRADGLDGWLLYDFQGVNPIARALAGLGGSRKMTTRRWYYLIPASGLSGAILNHEASVYALHALAENHAWAVRFRPVTEPPIEGVRRLLLRA